jgi:hypothetical protein
MFTVFSLRIIVPVCELVICKVSGGDLGQKSGVHTQNLFACSGRALARKLTRVYPKVSGLAAWSKNCKWYSSLPLDAVVSLFCKSV